MHLYHVVDVTRRGLLVRTPPVPTTRKPILPLLSLSFAVINSSVKGLMFQNTLMTLMTLKKGQVIGRVTMGSYAATGEAQLQIDCADLVQPGPRRHHHGHVLPQFVSYSFYTAVTPGIH